MKKIIFYLLLLNYPLIATVNLDLQLNITGHNKIQERLTFKNPTHNSWHIDSDTIIVTGNAPDHQEKTALITFNIYLKEDGKELKLIGSPTINTAWGQAAKLCIVEDTTDTSPWTLLLDVIATK